MAKLKTVLFDLDGTLLPMDQEKFTSVYFSALAKKLAPHGYEPDALIKAVWEGTGAMVKNDGSCTNEEAFWRTFCARMGETAREKEPVFEDFYKNEFQAAAGVCGFTEEAAKTVALCRTLGLGTVLATNPLFPAIATQSRIRWAGLSPDDFALYTTYETSHFCKPNVDYYREILEKLGCRADECVMVGNDAVEDLAAAELGMRVFLLTPCLIGRGRDISDIPHGGFAELQDFLCAQAE
ncbi:MAG: HAD family hydrolase [Oscillospiraceae bacterium]|nr:HAD family hydrolase [Oscillospiraceae bacterium]